MDEWQAVNACAALAQESRLRIVRLLVTAGPDGMPAGAVATAIGASPSTKSFHLKELQRASLVHSRKAGHLIVYGASFSALGGLIEFLMRDCC